MQRGVEGPRSRRRRARGQALARPGLKEIMCALCGAFGIADHWTDDAGEQSLGAVRQRRVAVANRFLAPYGLTLAGWADRFTLTSRTGGSLGIDNFGALWPGAEK